MRAIRLMFLFLFLVLIGSLTLAVRHASAQKTDAQQIGMAAKKPVFGGACKICPWGAIGEIVKTAVQPYGYDVQMCYSCAGGPQAARYVAAAAMPPPVPPSSSLANQMGPPPKAPVDFGATYATYLWWAYQGNHDFKGEGPRQNLRLIANIQDPTYIIAAVRTDSGITDLHQIVDKKMKVRIVTACCGAAVTAVLDYYGLTKQAVESLGGHIGGTGPDDKNNFDVIVGFGALDNSPEYGIWYELSQKFDLTYLQLPEDLLDKLAKEDDLQRVNIPDGLLRGIDHPMPTVARTGTVIYGRTDMPDDFSYAVAKALDEHQDLLQWGGGAFSFSYNTHNVWKAFGVPLHPGAAKYYRERGYMK